MQIIKKNLTYTTFISERVVRLRPFIQEYSSDLKYIAGKKNIDSDALLQINIIDALLEVGFIKKPLNFRKII